jgi:alkanesulfonate monooxygenase SsuD/methylene tetrahydromethanopterin reductase-like flavin-dependent oxidoreductase (luciferase family)
MHFGGAMFVTDYSMSAPELARALEERGFESVWPPELGHRGTPSVRFSDEVAISSAPAP